MAKKYRNLKRDKFVELGDRGLNYLVFDINYHFDINLNYYSHMAHIIFLRGHGHLLWGQKQKRFFFFT